MTACHHPTFGALWPLVRAWLGVVGVDSQSVSDHFLQFINYAGVSMCFQREDLNAVRLRLTLCLKK